MVEVVLRVAFEWVVVAAGAADARAEEGLRHRVRQVGLLGLALLAEVVDEVADGRCLAGGTARGEHVAGERIPRTVRGDLRTEPRVEAADALRAAHVVVALLAVLEQVGELQCPVVNKARTAEQLVGELGALGGGSVLGERGGNFSRRQRAGQVEVEAAGEGRVVAGRRGREAERLELLEDRVINGVLPRGEVGGPNLVGVRHRERDDLDEALEVDTHRGLACAQRGRNAGGRDLHGGLVVGEELREPGNVALAAIGVGGAGGDRNLVAGLQRAGDGGERELRDARLVRGRAGSAGDNPVAEQGVFAGAGGEPRAALVRFGGERLREQ